MEEFLKIGLIVKPQGVRGELKVQPLTDNYKRFSSLKEVFIGGKSYKVEKSRLGNAEVFLTLFGIADRNSAELMRGRFLCVDRQNAVKLPKDRYFIVDLIGCKLSFEGEEAFATLSDITEARTDIITADLFSGGKVRFPFLKEAVLSVDISAKKIILNKKRFTEIAVYED